MNKYFKIFLIFGISCLVTYVVITLLEKYEEKKKKENEQRLKDAAASTQNRIRENNEKALQVNAMAQK